jgi:hypothetical protein
MLFPEGITENVAKRQLDSLRNPRIPPKASEFMPDLRRFRYRSEFQENLRLLSLLLLDELEDNLALKKDFYRDCYVPIEANNRHLLLSKKIISSRYKAVNGNAIAQLRLGFTTYVFGRDRLRFWMRFRPTRQSLTKIRGILSLDSLHLST